MPTYDYKCSNAQCEHEFEGQAKMDARTPPCPKCRASTSKVFKGARPAPQLKGGGWAKDGYSSQKK